MSRVEQIKKFKVLPTEWAPGGDELTPTMKLKRKPIAEKYDEEIEALYAAVAGRPIGAAALERGRLPRSPGARLERSRCAHAAPTGASRERRLRPSRLGGRPSCASGQHGVASSSQLIGLRGSRPGIE